MTSNKKEILPTGKLDLRILQEIFDHYNSPEILSTLELSKFQQNYENSKKRVKLGFAIGEDASVLQMEDTNKYLVAKTDPITFATEEIGYYVVNVNANDIASMGATPKWFQATILLPAGVATQKMAKKICVDIQKACLNIGVLLIGGHTEVTYDLTRPIVVGSMLGEVEKEHYVQSNGGKPGDAIILTKGIPLEGTSIIAREKEMQLLKFGIPEDKIQKAKQLLFNPGISVIKEALLAAQNFNIHAMHDPTEGGIAMGLVELARASKCGFLVNYEKLPILPIGEKLCSLFGLNPLQTISSGSLLIVINNEDSSKLIQLLNKNNISCRRIGNLTDNKAYEISKNGKISSMKFSERDEIAKIFNER